MNTTHFYLVRHGETDWNVAHRLQGHTDIGLNATGLEQAKQMANALKASNLEFDVLYTSDLQRAKQTAKAIENIYQVTAIEYRALRERHLGALQGLHLDEAPLKEPELWKIHLSRDLQHDLNGGESITEFSERIRNGLEGLRQKHIGKTILLVSHGGALDMMYRVISNQALDTEKVISVPNASLSWISHNGNQWQIERWADTSHLQKNALDNLDL